MTSAHKAHFIFGLLGFMALSACKTAASGSAIASATAKVSTGASCTDDEALPKGKLQGDAVYDITALCVFSQDVHEVRIRILGETFEKVLADGCADKDTGYGHVIELALDGHSIENVGIKVRGNTSKCNNKRQFKFKIDEDEMFSTWQGKTETKKFPENEDRTFFGLDSFSVRSSVNDPAMIRENLSSYVFTKINELAPTTERGPLVYRTSFTKFFVSYNQKQHEGNFSKEIDGYFYDDKGFYSLSEDINKTFLNSRFAANGKKPKNFHLIEADKGAASLDPEQYDRKGWSAEYVNGKKAKDESDLKAGDAAILALAKVLNNKTSDDDLAKVIDVDSVINYMTSAMLTGDWDSLIANGNNDFLFFNDLIQKWQIIAWDLDNTQGANHDQYKNFMSDNIYAPAKARPNQIFTVLFAPSRQKFRDMLKDRLQKYTRTVYESKQFDDTVNQFRDTVKENALNWESFNSKNYEDIKDFAAKRYSSIKPQL